MIYSAKRFTSINRGYVNCTTFVNKIYGILPQKNTRTTSYIFLKSYLQTITT